MSDLDRLIALAGLATDDVAEGAYGETKKICKDCGDELHVPTTNCEHDSHDENGDNWVEVDIDGDGDADLAVNMEAEKKNCGCGQDPCVTYGKKNEAVGDAAECFYELQDDFAGGECPSGGHRELIDNLVRFLSGDQLEEFCDDFRRHYDMNEATLDEDDLDENAFNQAAAAAARAGKEEFEFNGKTYKTKMDKSTAHKLDDDVQFESEEELEETLEAVDVDTEEEVVAEAPTMDTTQLITLLRNAGLTEEAIEQKLTEWANTPSPDMANEQEPTEHGDAYDFAQNVNLSLKRYLDAEDMKVGLKEHKVEDLREAYEKAKKMPIKAEVMKCCEDGMTVSEICEKYKDCDKKKMKLLAASCMKEYKSK